MYQLLLQQLPWSDIWCLKVLTSILLHARNKMTSSEMLFVTMLYKAYPAITLTRQRGGYLHIIDFMEIPLRLKKLVKRLYFF
jgi:bifunctional pyridoxal-dependent enzyme with beta-cystathionase and maltose regulon repressor activities